MFNILLAVGLVPLALAACYIVVVAILGGIYGGTMWMVGREDWE